jgi:sugar/nucleoside kinase (ribokinase family)
MGLKTPYRISGTGCALVDYLYKSIDFSGDIFTNYISRVPGDGGLSPGKLVFTEEFEKFSGKPYELIRKAITGNMKPIGINLGGPSLVSLIHAAQLLHDLPAEVLFYGCKGDDDAGAFIDRKLKETPLKTGFYKSSLRFTPFTDVLSDPDYDSGHGERIFINNIGAAWEFLPIDLDNAFFESQITVFGGTALVPNIHRSLDQLLEKARSSCAITVVNTVYDFLNEKNNPDKPWPLGDTNTVYRFIDLLISDKEEALRHSGTQSAEDALEFFRQNGAGAAIITHGPNPVLFFSENELFGKIPPSLMPVSELVKKEIRENPEIAGDTTGCGDNFVGGVIASLARQQIMNPGSRIDLKQAIAMGIVSGGFACFYNGGTWFEGQPGEKASKIKKYLDSYLVQAGIK